MSGSRTSKPPVGLQARVSEPDPTGPLPAALRLQVIQLEQSSLLWQRTRIELATGRLALA